MSNRTTFGAVRNRLHLDRRSRARPTLAPRGSRPVLGLLDSSGPAPQHLHPSEPLAPTKKLRGPEGAMFH
jgi:hypothetical protein